MKFSKFLATEDFVYFFTSQPLTRGYMKNYSSIVEQLQYWDGETFSNVVGSFGEDGVISVEGTTLDGFGVAHNGEYVYRWTPKEQNQFHYYSAFTFVSNASFMLRLQSGGSLVPWLV